MTRYLTPEEVERWCAKIEVLRLFARQPRKKGPAFQTHCKRGHEIVTLATGRRVCKICEYDRRARFKERAKVAA